MGKITINELSNSLLEYIENNTENKQDKTDSSLKTTDKTIVGAINELFQNANNGKQLIADAIGSPLSSSQTFSAMSTSINSLLSAFKTNMANAGATVNSSDKFEQLINKITTLGGGGLDIISAASLPSTGKENQLCAITNNVTDSFILSNDDADVMNSGDNTIGLLLSDLAMYEKYSYPMGGLAINLRIAVTYQNATAIPLWLYYNNTWKQICSTTLFIIRDKVIQDGFTIDKTNNYGTYDSKGISLLPGSDANLFGFTPFKESIDFSKYKAVRIKGTYQNTSTTTGEYGPAIGIFGVTSNLSGGTMSGVGYGISDIQSVFGSKFSRTEVFESNIKTATFFDITFDVSSITTQYYLGIATAMTQYTYVTDIELIMTTNALVNPYEPGTNVNNTGSSLNAYQYNPKTKTIPVEADGKYTLSFSYGPNISNQGYTASISVRIYDANGATVESYNESTKYGTSFSKDLSLKKGYKIDITASISTTTHSSHCNQVTGIKLVFKSL